MKLFFLFTFVLSATAWADSCGLEGTIEERIKSCNLIKENFVLVTRSEKGIEIFKDIKSGLIWGDRISTEFNHYGSQKACSDIPEAELLKGMKWRLPTIREFEGAASRGMKTSLSRMNHAFWSSTPVKIRSKRRGRKAIPAQNYLWDGVEERTDRGDLKDAASVRCVTR